MVHGVFPLKALSEDRVCVIVDTHERIPLCIEGTLHPIYMS